MGTMHEVRIEGRGLLTWTVRPVGKAWLAQCDAIKLCIEADSAEEVDATIRETMDLTLRSLFSSGEFERFLHDRGWHVSTTTPIPQGITEDRLTFRAPVSVQRDLYATA